MELLLDLGCSLLPQRFTGGPHSFSGSTCAKEALEFPQVPLGLETHNGAVRALALRLVDCGLDDCLFLFYFSP